MSTPFFVSSNEILLGDNLFAISSECANTTTNTTCIPNNQHQDPTMMSASCFPHEYDPAIITGSLSPSSAAVPIAIPSTTNHSTISYSHPHNNSLLSPFSASDESLYSFSPENDTSFAPSSFGSSMADLMFTDDTTAATNVSNNTTMLQDQHDFCLNELLGSPVSFNMQSSSFDQQQMSISSPAMSSTSSCMFMQHDMVSPAMSHFETTPFLDHMELGTTSLTTPQMGYLDPTSMMAPSTMSVPSSSSSSSSSGTKKRRRGTGPRIHYCPHCPHTSNRANNMKEHVLTHDPNRPKNHLCPLCGKRFARKHDMKRHAKSPHPSPVSCNTSTLSSPSFHQL